MKRVAKWQHKLSALDLFVKELRTVSYVLTSTQQTTHKNDGTFSFCVCVCDNLLHARDRQHNVEDVYTLRNNAHTVELYGKEVREWTTVGKHFSSDRRNRCGASGCGTARRSLPWWSDMLYCLYQSVTEMERWMGGPDGYGQCVRRCYTPMGHTRRLVVCAAGIPIKSLAFSL